MSIADGEHVSIGTYSEMRDLAAEAITSFERAEAEIKDASFELTKYGIADEGLSIGTRVYLLTHQLGKARQKSDRLQSACEFALAVAEGRVLGGTWDDVMLEMRAALDIGKEQGT